MSGCTNLQRHKKHTIGFGDAHWIQTFEVWNPQDSHCETFGMYTPTPSLVSEKNQLNQEPGVIHREGCQVIQVDVPTIYPNALPPSYRAWGALFTITKAQPIHARLVEVVARECNDSIHLSWNHCLLSWALKKMPKSLSARLPYRHMPPNGWSGTVTVETLPSAPSVLTFPHKHSSGNQEVRVCHSIDVHPEL